MNLEETDQLLTLIQNVDKRRVDDATVLVWHEILGDLPFPDCVIAVTTHFRESTDYLMPAHIVRGAREIERKRIREERAQLAIEQAPITDPRPLSDRSAEIREFVAGVRSVLPEGDPDTLWHGRGHWRRVREAREIALPWALLDELHHTRVRITLWPSLEKPRTGALTVGDGTAEFTAEELERIAAAAWSGAQRIREARVSRDTQEAEHV